jgi:predicted membrane channel-forming protein YqfA (hemolysin III family)
MHDAFVCSNFFLHDFPQWNRIFIFPYTVGLFVCLFFFFFFHFFFLETMARFFKILAFFSIYTQNMKICNFFIVAIAYSQNFE